MRRYSIKLTKTNNTQPNIRKMADTKAEVKQTIEEVVDGSLNDNSVVVVNIRYSPISNDGVRSKRKNLPEFFVLDLPERITQLPDKSDQKYFDLIETFVYNTLTKKFQTEVANCQIWIQ